MSRARRSRESGYALLFVFLTVAMIAMAMYTAMPRVVFEEQRDQEQLLIDRGEQYKRAIQLYVRKFKKYPGKIEDLEDTNGMRFLRQRYTDPLSGKDEWRLIHIGGAGQFTDSLTQKNTQKKTTQASANTFITELQMGSTEIVDGPKVGIGMRRRPSDPSGFAEGSSSGGGLGTSGFDPTNPDGSAGLPSTSASNSSNQNAAPGIFDPAQTASNAGGASVGAAATVLAATSANQAASGADVIRNILTSPRPGGPPPGIFGGDTINDVGFINGQGNNSATASTDPFGNNGSGSTPVQNVNAAGSTNGVGSTLGTSLAGNTPGGLTIGGGIAGVASKVTREGIKLYKDRQKYNEWEFIYDQSKDTSMGGLQAQQNMINAQRNQANSTAMGTGLTDSSGTNASTAAPVNIPSASPGPPVAGFGRQPFPSPTFPNQQPFPTQPQLPVTVPVEQPVEPTNPEQPVANPPDSGLPPSDQIPVTPPSDSPQPPVTVQDPTNPQ